MYNVLVIFPVKQILHNKSVKWHKITNDHIASFKYCMNSCLQSDVMRLMYTAL